MLINIEDSSVWFAALARTTVAIALPVIVVTGAPTVNLEAAAITLSESRAQTLVDGCILYVAKNGGVFPEKLEKLVDEKYISGLSLLKDPLSQAERSLPPAASSTRVPIRDWLYVRHAE